MIRAVLIDLSGTLHIENQVIPGAVEALKKFVPNLQNAEKAVTTSYIFCTLFVGFKKQIL